MGLYAGRQKGLADRAWSGARSKLEAMSANRPTLRLLLPAMLLPACVAFSDEVVLKLASANRWSSMAVLAVLAWFVFQTALLSYVAGSKLPTWSWRLLVLGWTLVLINLLLPASTTYAGGSEHIELLQCMLGRAFLTGEIASTTIWLVLGGVSLMRRLGLALLAALPATYLALALEFPSNPAPVRWGGNEAWNVIIIVQVLGVAAMAVLLWFSGFRIEPVKEASTNGSGEPTQFSVRPQFSIRHLIMATTFVAILTFGAQWAAKASSHTLFGGQWVHASVVGALLALCSLAALWMALGVGPWPVRVFVFAILTVGVGASAEWLESNIRYAERWGRIRHLTDMHDLWPAWTLLTGSFVAGMLLVLRASGFRLVKKAQLANRPDGAQETKRT